MEMVPVRPLGEIRAFLKGIDRSIERAGSGVNVVDSSGWLEYFADAANADFFAPAIEDTPALVVPSISLYEVFERVLQQRHEGDALQAIASMMQRRVVSLDAKWRSVRSGYPLHTGYPWPIT